MAAAMFVSCSNDVLTEEGVNTDGNKPVGDVAYMAVKISNVNDRIMRNHALPTMISPSARRASTRSTTRSSSFSTKMV